MRKFRTLYMPNTAFGGAVYSATTDGKSVRLREDGKCKLEMSLQDFENQVREIDWDFSTIAALIAGDGELLGEGVFRDDNR
tara:strand:- start:2612 stop:2854 length:243 start_codon:yes stop_codon:yes gene_type:complete